MNRLQAFANAVFVILFSVMLYGCLPIIPTEKAFVVIVNNTDRTVEYAALLNERWLPLAPIKAKETEYFFDYETSEANEPLPFYLSSLKLVLYKCTIKVNRMDLEKYFVRDPDGRKGWNLYINNDLLKAYGCD